MISFSGSLKIFLLVDCCDMRKGFNGLYGLVSSSFGGSGQVPRDWNSACQSALATGTTFSAATAGKMFQYRSSSCSIRHEQVVSNQSLMAEF
jgi:hypothetical protein